nr:hypothetical protein [Tanacetum cinerariifolium]
MYYKKNLDFLALIWEDLAYQIDNMDSKKQDKIFYPRFTKIIIHRFFTKDKSISMRNRTFMHTTRDDSLLGVETLKSRRSLKKSNSAITSEESPSKKKPVKAKKDVLTTKPKLSKKKAYVKATRGKGLNVLSEASGFGTNEGTGSKPGVLDVPKYVFESDKEPWGDSDEDDIKDEGDNDDNDDNDDDGDSDEERTESDKDEILDPNKSNDKHAKGEEEYNDERVHTLEDYELTNEKKIDYEEKVEQRNRMFLKNQDLCKKRKMLIKLLNLENVSSAENEIASFMDINILREETSSQTSSLHTVPITAIPKVTTTIPLPPPFFNPLQ